MMDNSQLQSQRTSVFTLCVYAIGIGLFVLNLVRNRFFLHDDAFISLRYARNFADHGDLSWNLGDKVEGYTNFLYVMISSALLYVGTDPVLTVRLINGLAVGLLVGAVYYGARAMFPDRKDAHAFGVTLVLANISVVVWFYGGLEAPLASAFIAWAVAFLIRALTTQHQTTEITCLALSGAAFALAVLTRPDGVILVAGTFFAYVVLAPGTWKAKIGKGAILAGIPFVIFMIHMGWRISYYGDTVPNTFHAKVGLSLSHRLERVFEYILKSTALYLPVLACAGLAFFAALVWGKVTQISKILIALSICFLLYVVWSGGDHMPAARVLLPLAGPIALLAVSLWGSLRGTVSHALSAAFLALLVFASLNGRSFQMDWAAFNGTIIGRYIEEAWPEGSLVALNTAGSTPFFGASHEYIDMLGLNDRTIALREDVPILARRQAMPGHGKGDGAYVMSREPDYIILGGAEGIQIEEASKWFLTGVELQNSAVFEECYDEVRVPLELPADMAKFRSEAKAMTFTYYKNVCG